MKDPLQETKHQAKRRNEDLVKDRAVETYLLLLILTWNRRIVNILFHCYQKKLMYAVVRKIRNDDSYRK